MGDGRGVYRVLGGRPKGKRSLERPRCRWEDNIKIDLREIGIDQANWIHWRAFMSTVMNFRIPYRKQAFV
jgi:hypothetical protein